MHCVYLTATAYANGDCWRSKSTSTILKRNVVLTPSKYGELRKDRTCLLSLALAFGFHFGIPPVIWLAFSASATTKARGRGLQSLFSSIPYYGSQRQRKKVLLRNSARRFTLPGESVNPVSPFNSYAKFFSLTPLFSGFTKRRKG